MMPSRRKQSEVYSDSNPPPGVEAGLNLISFVSLYGEAMTTLGADLVRLTVRDFHMKYGVMKATVEAKARRMEELLSEAKNSDPKPTPAQLAALQSNVEWFQRIIHTKEGGERSQ